MLLTLLNRVRSPIFLNKINTPSILSSHVTKRPFFHWLNIIFNQIDPQRVKTVGIERVCAEWLLRNGAAIKWVGCHKFMRDYNLLPKEEVKFHIEEVDASCSSISHYGFIHFEGCSSIKRIVLHDCVYIENEALHQLHFVANTLMELQVSMCGNISDDGIRHLKNLSKLKNLILFDLFHVKEKQVLVEELQAFLPKCQISFDDIEGSYYNEAYKMKRTYCKKDTLQ